MAETNAPEHQDRGLSGLFGKKKDEPTHQQNSGGVDPQGYGNVQPVPPHASHEEPKYRDEGERIAHEGRMGAQLNRSNSSSSSSSSDEEGGEKGEKKKKKKGGLKEKLPGGEKKEGFVEKIKEKLPEKKEGEQQHNVGPVRPPPSPTEEEVGEKKGLMEKIKEKIPGHHNKEEKSSLY